MTWRLTPSGYVPSQVFTFEEIVSMLLDQEVPTDGYGIEVWVYHSEGSMPKAKISVVETLRGRLPVKYINKTASLSAGLIKLAYTLPDKESFPLRQRREVVVEALQKHADTDAEAFIRDMQRK